MVIWDCPGFNDTDVVQEIANSFYIKRLFETTKYLKFILVISEHDLQSKGAQFVQTLASFTKVFSNVQAIEGSVSLVVTHVAPHKNAQHIKNSINKILEQNQQVTDEQKELIGSILNKSFHLFHKPKDEGEMEAVDLFTPINQSSWYILSNPDMASISVSEKAKACSAGLLSTASNNFNKILGTIAKAIVDASKCLKTDPTSNVFLQNYNIVKDWVPSSIHYKGIGNHNPAEYFLQLDHLTMLAKLLSSHNQVIGIAEGINILQQAIEVFAEYTNDTQLKHQMQDYGYTLAQQYEYIRFFSEVCGRALPDHLPLAKLIEECHNKVRENLEYQIKTLQLNENHNDPVYYHKAIEYLDNYHDSQACKKLKAVAYCGLANIAQQHGDNNKAIDCYYKAINTYKQLPEAYEKLGKLFFDKGDYAKAINCYKVINNEYEIKSCFKEWLKQTPKNPNIMLKQAEYFESIGSFEAAKKYYGYAAGLSRDATFKANALKKEANALSEHSKKLAAKAEELNLRAEHGELYNFEEINLDEMEGYQLPIIGNNDEGFGIIYH